MLRIGIVTATYLPSKNGVAVSTHLLVEGLRALGHEVRVFVPDYPNAEDSPGVHRLPSWQLGTPPDYPILLPPSPRLRARLPLEGLDVLHTMHPFIAGRMALGWSRQLGIPLIFTAHTQYHSYAHYAPLPRPVTQRLIRQHVRAFANAADRVVVPGRAMLDALRDYGYHGDVTILPNPVDHKRFAGLEPSTVRERYAIPKDAPVTIYVGRLAPEKNLELLLGAFKAIHRERPDAHFLVVGDGPSTPRLKRLAADLPVHFAGAVTPDEVPRHLAAADLFASASLTETGTPLTFLEAFAAGKPVVTVADNDLVEDDRNGLHCPAEAAALARGILSLLQDRNNLQDLSRGARASALPFDVAAHAQAMEQLYRQVLLEHPLHAPDRRRALRSRNAGG
jgi:glycosyltransferase involved in cell wall biosynthesis